VTLMAFDSSAIVLGSVGSNFASNLALSGIPGSSPNELLQLLSAVGISYVTITADPLGGSFVVDDLQYEDIAAVPEPATLGLVGTGVTLFAARRRRKGK
jgi:hypothetical protein